MCLNVHHELWMQLSTWWQKSSTLLHTPLFVVPSLCSKGKKTHTQEKTRSCAPVKTQEISCRCHDYHAGSAQTDSPTMQFFSVLKVDDVPLVDNEMLQLGFGDKMLETQMPSHLE